MKTIREWQITKAIKGLSITDWLLALIAILLALITWKLYSIPTTGEFRDAYRERDQERIEQLRAATPRFGGEVQVTNDVTVNGEVSIDGEVSVTGEVSVSRY